MSDETGDNEKHAYKCDLCSLSYHSEKDLREHFWSLMHHVNIEQKKKNTLHNCTLCFTACASLSEYRKHLNGEKHKKTLEQSRIAEEEKASEPESKKPTRKKKLRAPPSQKIVEESSHQDNDNEGDVQSDTEMGGYTRDPVFYKRRQNRQQEQDNQEQPPMDNYNRRSRWDNPDPYWDQGFDHLFNNDYFQNDYPIGWGRPEFPNGLPYGWHPQGRKGPGWHPRGREGPGGFRAPPRGAPPCPPMGYIDFSDKQRQGEEKCLEWEGGEEEKAWRNQEMGRGWNNYDKSRYSWRKGNTLQRNSFEEPEIDYDKEMWKEGWKKSKKKKKKWKTGGGEKGNNSSVNSDSPDNSNVRKRCRDFEFDSLSSKTFRFSFNADGGNDNVSVSHEKDTDTLSSSVRSTSSSHSKSSNKSRSNSNSPSMRLKSVGTRKLKNTRNSPKGFRVPLKLKQASRILRSEIENSDGNSESSGVLEKAEKLCKELREKRTKAKLDQEKLMKCKKNQHRETINRQIKLLAEANKSRIKGHLVTAEKHQGASSSEVSGRESGIATFTSSQTSDFSTSGTSISSSRTQTSQGESQSSSTPVFRSDIDRIRHDIESSVRKTATTPVKATTAGESPGQIPKSRRPLSKDSLLKMVNSPRSRNERMQLARMLRSHTKSMNKLAPSRLNVQMNGLYDNCEFEDLDIPAISLEDLSPEVKLQIAQLIEDNVNVDGEVPTSPMTSLRGPTSKEPEFPRPEAVNHPSFRLEGKTEAVADDALFLDDLRSPEPIVHNQRTSAYVNSSDKEAEQPVLSVTSVNGVPQLQVSEPSVVSNLHVSEETVTSNTQPHSISSPGVTAGQSAGASREDDRSTVVSTAVDLGRRALEMSCLLDRQSPVLCSTSSLDLESASDMSAVVELSLKEEEKHRELEELDQKMEIMRKMLKRTLEHLDKSEQRRKKLMNDTKMIREHRLNILKEITGHPTLTAAQQIIEPSSSATNKSSSSVIVQPESMELDPTTDSVSSTSQAQAVDIRTELSSPGAQADDNLDHTTRPVSISTVTAPCYSFTKEASTNPALSLPSSRDDRPSSSLAPSCVSVKRESFSPTLEVLPSSTFCTSLIRVGDGNGAVTESDSSTSVVRGNLVVSLPYTSPSICSFSSSPDPRPDEIFSPSVSFPSVTRDVSSVQSVPVVVVSSPNTSHQSSAPNASDASGEDRLASFTNWSPLADRLSCVTGSPVRRSKSADTAVSSITQTLTNQNLPLPKASTIKINGVPRAEDQNKDNFQFEITAKDSSSSGFCSGSTKECVSNLEKTPVKDSAVIQSQTISESSDGDQSKKSQSVPMAYLGSISGGEGTGACAALLKKLAADLGNLGNVNTMSCVMLDKQEMSDKFPGMRAKLRNNSESNVKSPNYTSDIQWMELDLKGENSGKESTPREESEGGSAASTSSLGEKIQRYCHTDRRMSLDVIEGGGSDADRTLKEEDMAEDNSDNTPGKILKHCSVVLQKLELEQNGEEQIEEQTQNGKVMCHEVIDLDNLESVEKGENPSLNEPIINLESSEPSRDISLTKNTTIDLENQNKDDKDISSSLMKGPSSPGRKKRRTKKERDILANRRSYWFDSSSDNNSQEDENVPKLSSLKQQLVFTQKDDSSEADVDAQQESVELKHEEEKGLSVGEVVEKSVVVTGDSPTHPLLQQTEVGTSLSQQRPSKSGNMSVNTAQKDSISTNEPRFSKSLSLDKSHASATCTGNRQSDTGHRQSNTISKEPVSVQNNPKPSKPSDGSTDKTSSSVMFTGPSESVTSMQVFNKHLYVSYTGQDIRRFHVQTGKLDLVYNCSYHSVQCMTVVSAPGREDCIFAGGLSFFLILFNVKSPQIVNTFELSEEIKCMHYDCGFVYVGLVSGSVEVFDVKNQRHKDSFQCAYQAIHCISSAREGGSRLICVSAQDTTISVCDARSGLPVRILGGHTKTSFSVITSDHFVFSGSGDRTVMMHNLHTGKLEWTFSQHGGIVTSVWVEGNYLYSAGYDRIVRCFDIKNHTLKRMFYGACKGVIMRMAIYGNKLYTGNRDGQVESLDMGSESWPCQMCNCQFVFGLREHLLHHLLTDHTDSTSKITRCTWKDCSDWLTLTRDDGSVESHMRKHIENLEGKC